MISILAQDTKIVTVSINGKLSHLTNHCLLRGRGTILPQNNYLFDTVGKLMASYNNRGLGQHGIEGNAFFNLDGLFNEWNDSLLAAFAHAPMQYLEVSEELYQKHWEVLPPLIYRCKIYNPKYN